jgi:multiple sugar transport system substrate-binding protein
MFYRCSPAPDPARSPAKARRPSGFTAPLKSDTVRPNPMRLASALCALALFSSACIDGHSEKTAGVRRLVYWEKWTDFEGEAMARVVDGFNAKERARAKAEPSYRRIEVEVVTISSIEQKLLIASAGGNPPDVAGVYSFMIPSYADKGALMDLTERARRDGVSRDQYVGRYYDLAVHREKLWGLPTTPASVALHWNKRLFREAGLDPERPPETLEQLDEMAEKLTQWEVTLPSGKKVIESGYLPHVPVAQKRLIQAGFLPSEPDWWSYGWGFVFGGKLLDGDQVTAASPENIQAYEWVASYTKKLGVDAVQRFRSGFGKFGTAQNPFLTGKLAMEIQGVWMYNFIKKFADGMQWGAAPFPAPAAHPERHGTANAEVDALAIPTGSKHPEEAWEFIKYTQRRDVMDELCLGQRKHTPLAQVSEEFYARHPNPYIRLFRELGASPNAWSAPKTGVWNEYLREMTTAADKIANLTSTPREALSQVQERIQVSYDRDRRIFLRRSE